MVSRAISTWDQLLNNRDSFHLIWVLLQKALTLKAISCLSLALTNTCLLVTISCSSGNVLRRCLTRGLGQTSRGRWSGLRPCGAAPGAATELSQDPCLLDVPNEKPAFVYLTTHIIRLAAPRTVRRPVLPFVSCKYDHPGLFCFMQSETMNKSMWTHEPSGASF